MLGVLLLVATFGGPALAAPRGSTEGILEFAATRFLLGVGFFGVAFRVAAFHHQQAMFQWILGGGLLALGLTGGLVRRLSAPPTSGAAPRDAIPTPAILIAAPILIAAYWSLGFPPQHIDTLYYHLPVARISAEPELMAFYTNHFGRFPLLVEGASGANLLAHYLSGYFGFESEGYRIAPPLILGCYLVGAMALGQRLGLPSRTSFVAIALLLACPVVATKGSDYGGDLLLSAYALASGTWAIRLTESDSREGALGAGLMIGALLAFACLTKKSGAAVAILPSLAFAAHARLNARLSTRSLLLASSIAFILPATALLSYASGAPTHPFPATGSSADFGDFLRDLITTGVASTLEWRRPESLNPLVFYGGLFAAPFVWNNARRTVAPLATFGLAWTALMLFAVWSSGRLDWFAWWTRYLLPALAPLALTAGVAVSALADRAGTRLFLAPLLAALLYSFPTAYWLNRFDDERVRDAASREERLVAAHGDLARAWLVANQAASEARGRVLTSDIRILFANVGCYEAWSIPPGTATVDGIHRWLLENRVTHVLDHDGWPQGFASTDPAFDHGVRRFLRSDDARLIWAEGTHRVFEVVDAVSQGPL